MQPLEHKQMRIKEDYRLQELGDDHLLIGPAPDGRRRVIRLNAAAAFLWRSAAGTGRDFTVADLAALLQAEYDLDPAVADRDARRLADAWIEAGLVLA